MCIVTAQDPDDGVVASRKVVYREVPARRSYVETPVVRRSYVSQASPRTSVTRTVYTEPVREPVRQVLYDTRGGRGSRSEVVVVQERRSDVGSSGGSRRYYY